MKIIKNIVLILFLFVLSSLNVSALENNSYEEFLNCMSSQEEVCSLISDIEVEDILNIRDKTIDLNNNTMTIKSGVSIEENVKIENGTIKFDSSSNYESLFYINGNSEIVFSELTIEDLDSSQNPEISIFNLDNASGEINFNNVNVNLLWQIKDFLKSTSSNINVYFNNLNIKSYSGVFNFINSDDLANYHLKEVNIDSNGFRFELNKTYKDILDEDYDMYLDLSRIEDKDSYIDVNTYKSLSSARILYNVKTSIEGAKLIGDEKVNINNTYFATITPIFGYKYDINDIKITSGDYTLNLGTDYEFNKETGELVIYPSSSIKDDILIEGSATEIPRLSKMKNLNWNDKVISFEDENNESNIDYYVIILIKDGIELKRITSYNKTIDLSDKMTEGGIYTFKVYAISSSEDYLDSEETESSLPFILKEYGINVISSSNGNVIFEKEKVVEGDTATITIIPEEGYEVDKVFVNGQAREIVNNSFDISNIQDDIEIAVTYKVKQLKIKFEKTEEINISSDNPFVVNYGDSKEIEIFVNDGYNLLNVYVNGADYKIENGKIILSNIKEDITITFKVEKKLTVDKVNYNTLNVEDEEKSVVSKERTISSEEVKPENNWLKIVILCIVAILLTWYIIVKTGEEDSK